MIETTLTWGQIEVAAFVGLRRALRAKRANRTTNLGDDPGLIEPDVIGAIAELAVAKILGVYWPLGAGGLDYDGDLTPGIHVRGTERRNGCLILKPHDPDDGIFYLGLVDMPRVTLAGGIVPRDGKLPELWREDVPAPAFFVPQSRLTLPPNLKGEYEQRTAIHDSRQHR